MTRRPILSRSTRSNFRVSSISARSPRAHVGDDGAHRLLDVLGQPRAWWRETRQSARENRRIGCRGGSASRAVRPGSAPVSPVNGPRRMARQPCLDASRLSPSRTTSVWAGQHSVPQAGPEIGQFGLQAFDLEPKRRAAREDQGDDAGGLIGCLEARPPAGSEPRSFSTGVQLRHLQARHPLEPQRRRGAGGIAARRRWPPPSRNG